MSTTTYLLDPIASMHRLSTEVGKPSPPIDHRRSSQGEPYNSIILYTNCYIFTAIDHRHPLQSEPSHFPRKLSIFTLVSLSCVVLCSDWLLTFSNMFQTFSNIFTPSTLSTTKCWLLIGCYSQHFGVDLGIIYHPPYYSWSFAFRDLVKLSYEWCCFFLSEKAYNFLHHKLPPCLTVAIAIPTTNYHHIRGCSMHFLKQPYLTLTSY